MATIGVKGLKKHRFVGLLLECTNLDAIRPKILQGLLL